MKQQGNTKDMIFPIPALIEYVSSITMLQVCPKPCMVQEVTVAEREMLKGE
jgi:hypothetical protein